MKFIKVLFVLLFCIPVLKNHSIAQLDTRLDSIRWYADAMAHTENADHRKYAFDLLNEVVYRFLDSDKDLTQSVDSLYGGKFIVSRDSQIRITTFQVLDENNIGRYLGYVQLKGESPIQLKQAPTQMSVQAYRALPAHRWTGAVYETIVDHEFQGQKQYIVIGYIFQNERTWSHIVDVININDHTITTGAPIFVDKEKEDTKYRIVHSFMAGSGAAIKYISDDDKIIMDHLSTVIDPMSGQEQQVPDGTYVAYQREDELWKFVEYANTPDRRPVSPDSIPQQKIQRDIFGRKIK